MMFEFYNDIIFLRLLHDHQRFALPKVREFVAGHAQNQSQIETIKYKLRTKAKLKPSCRNQS